MEPFLTSEFGNPSSNSDLGRHARHAVDQARQQLADLSGCKPEEMIFVSGGTESCFSAIAGFFRAQAKSQIPGVLIHSGAEHPAVLEAGKLCSEMGLCQVLELGVDPRGQIDLEQLEDLAAKNPGALVSCMLANNETGIISPLKEISGLIKKHGCYLHTDAVQAVGKVPVSFSDLAVNFLSLSGHKFGAPKGIGALIINPETPWSALIKGGGQEANRRGGTEAVAQIVGMGAAGKLRAELLEQGVTSRLGELRRRLEQELLDRGIAERIIGQGVQRLPNTTSAVILDVNSQKLIENLGLRQVYVSAGSACSAGTAKPSRVLCALGVPLTDCLSTIRISLGVNTQAGEVDSFIDILGREVELERKRLLS